MDPRFDPLFDWSRLSPGNETPTWTSRRFMNYGTKLDQVLILQFLWGFVIQVYEKLK
jgi:hypothetical protein